MQPQTQILVLASLARIPAGRPVQADQPARLALELRGAKRTVFAPPGIDTSLFCPPEPDRPRQSLLSVGRLGDPRKGFRKLFRAYAALRKQRPDSPRLVVAGTGALPAAEQEFLRTNELAEWVDVRRDVTKQELVRLYQQASLFVLASDEEGFGFVLIEAMACATPVVSTASGGPNLIVDDGVTGLLVPVGEPTALVAGMKQCLDDPALARRLGEAGRTRAVEVYSQEAAAERIFVEYDRLLCGA
jgi:glycosyltransferase involved in cell wall biosynthesis